MIKVLLRGEVFSRNENGKQCRRVVKDLLGRDDIDIYLISTSGNDSGWIYEDNEERAILDGLLKKTSKFIRENQDRQNMFDVSIQVQEPSEWDTISNNNIGFFLGTPVQDISPSLVHGLKKADFVLVFDESNRAKLKDVGIESQIYGYGKRGSTRNLSKETTDDFSNYNFLVNAKWHPENDIERTITAFIQEFMNEDVGLILRTSVRNYSEIDRHHTIEYLESLASMFPQERKCKIHLLHGLLDREQEEGLPDNKNIFCVINCSHSMTTSSDLVMAYNSGISVISPSTGFFSDLSEEYFRVENKIDNLTDRHITNKTLSLGDKWSYVDILDLRKKMREAYSNKGIKEVVEKNTEQDENMLYNIIKNKKTIKEKTDEIK